MLFILILSTLASLSFRKAAQQKGYCSPQFWLFPLAVGGTISIAIFLLELILNFVVGDRTSTSMRVYPYRSYALKA